MKNIKSLGNYCMVCGALISENNPDGIGYSCREFVQKAKYAIINNDEEHKWDLRNIQMEVYMDAFIEKVANTKFRSQFKKDFSESVIEQWNKTHRLSNKQFDIVSNIICDPNYYRGQMIDGIPLPLAELNGRVKELRRDYIHKYFEEHTDKATEIIPMSFKLRNQSKEPKGETC